MENLTGTASILWRGKYLIVVALLLGIISAALATRIAAKVYESSGLIQVAAQVPSTGGEVLGVQQASQDLASTYATLVTSRSFLARIQGQIEHGRLSVSYLADNVQANTATQNTQSTNLIKLVGHGPSAEEARLLTQQVAEAFVRTISQDTSLRAKQQQQELQGRVDDLTRTINRLSSRKGSEEEILALKATRAALTNQLAGTIAEAVGRKGAVTVVAPAIASNVPIKPRPLLNEVLGAALGLLIGVGAAWLRSVLDRELHSSEEVESLVGLPVLASIPLRRSSGADDLVTREAYDVLRTNLTFLSVEAPLAVLTVTSSASGEGKSATVEGLGLAARRRDLNVLLIDGDLRTGHLSTLLGAGSRPGLVNAIVAGANLNSTIVELRPGLSLLPAGPAPPNPPSVLSSPKMAKLVEELRQRFDLILIDSPPVGNLADAALLAALSDASVLVARAGQTARASLVAAAAALSRPRAPIVGVVVFERRSLDPVYYPAGGVHRERPSPDDVAKNPFDGSGPAPSRPRQSQRR